MLNLISITSNHADYLRVDQILFFQESTLGLSLQRQHPLLEFLSEPDAGIDVSFTRYALSVVPATGTPSVTNVSSIFGWRDIH